MIKWFVYIVVLLIFAPCLSSAKTKNFHGTIAPVKPGLGLPLKMAVTDTTAGKGGRRPEPEERIKEVAKARKQPKPEKIGPGEVAGDSKLKVKPKRQRRPEGLERPPEIPRRNGN